MGKTPKKRSFILPINNSDDSLKEFIQHLTVFMETQKKLWIEGNNNGDLSLSYLYRVEKWIQNKYKYLLSNNNLKEIPKILKEGSKNIQDFTKSLNQTNNSKTHIQASIQQIESIVNKCLSKLILANKVFLIEPYTIKKIKNMLSEWVRVMIFTSKNKMIPERCIQLLKNIDSKLTPDLLEIDVYNNDSIIKTQFHQMLLSFIANLSYKTTIEEMTKTLTAKSSNTEKFILDFLQQWEIVIIEFLNKILKQRQPSFLKKTPNSSHSQRIYDFIPNKWRTILDPLEEREIVIGREKRSKRGNSTLIYQENSRYLRNELDIFDETHGSFCNFLLKQNKKHVVFVDVQNICRVSFLFKSNNIIKDFIEQPNVNIQVMKTIFDPCDVEKYKVLYGFDSYWIYVNKGNVRKDTKTGIVKILESMNGGADSLYINVACYDSKTFTDCFHSLGGDEMDDIFIVNAVLDLFYKYKTCDKFPIDSITVLSHDTFSNFKDYKNMNCPIFHHPKNLLKKPSEFCQ